MNAVTRTAYTHCPSSPLPIPRFTPVFMKKKYAKSAARILAGALLFLRFCASVAAQQTFTLDDTLRGSITPERAWWDLTFYRLEVSIDPDLRYIKGQNEIRYRVLSPGQIMQIDLQPPLELESVEQDGVPLPMTRRGANAWMVALQKPQKPGAAETVIARYAGVPREAANAPWDGGFVWSKDRKGGHFIATACQGIGASVWWPCKDHAYDEPDSMQIALRAPQPLFAVANGRLRGIREHEDGTRSFEWAVVNPINNYGVNANVAEYVHFEDTLHGANGLLTLDYYVLPYNLLKAKAQFEQAKQTLRAFEHWFGPYPFYEDGYKLVEVPYLGMEHQSSVTYGNGYKNGYKGRDLSGTGHGLKWDFIIVHESGHEWFANSITARDVADMWIHEGFTCYSEGLFTEYYYGKEVGAAYLRGLRRNIRNDRPITGIYGVNYEGSGDMYYKGANMLHTIRQIVADDARWLNVLRGLNRDFYHRTVDAKEVEDWMSREAGRDLSRVFEQYLRDTRIPVFEYRIKKRTLEYRWADCIPGFDMPLKVALPGGSPDFIFPTTQWKKMPCSMDKSKELAIDPDFYIFAKKN